MKPATKFAVALFALGAVLHLFRLFTGLEIIVGGAALPTWVSAPAALVAGTVAWMIVREHKGA